MSRCLLFLLAGLLALTGCTKAHPSSPTPIAQRSLFEPGAYNEALHQLQRRGMIVKVKRVQATPTELQVLDEGGLTFTWTRGEVRGPDKYDNPEGMVALEPSRFEVPDLGKLWQALAPAQPATMSAAPQRLQLQQYTVWTKVRASTPYSAVELDGTLYQDPVPADAAGIAALLDRVRPISTTPLGILAIGESLTVLTSPTHQVTIDPDGSRRETDTSAPVPASMRPFELTTVDPTAWAATAAKARTMTTFTGHRVIQVLRNETQLIYRFSDSNGHAVTCWASGECSQGQQAPQSPTPR